MTLLEKTPKKLSRNLETYRKIAIALNSFPKGEKISIIALADKANVHWNTAKKALMFFQKVGPLIPEFKMEQDFQFQVKKKPHAIEAVEGIFESKEMRTLTKMMLIEATEPQKAKELKENFTVEEKTTLSILIEKGFVNSIDGKFYLSKRGQAIGSMGIRKIVDLNIPLPWESMLEPVRIRSRKPVRPRLEKRCDLLATPKPIYPAMSLEQAEKPIWKTYIS